MPSEPFPIAGSAGQLERSGVVHFDLHYMVDGPRGAGDPEPYETLLSFKPQSTPFNLPEVGRAFNKQEDGDWLLVIHVEGLPSGQAGLLLMEIDHAGSEDPIESFPQYLALAKKWKAYALNQGKFQGWNPQIKDPETGEMVQNPLLGTTHFLNDTAIFRVTFVMPQWDQRVLYNICKVDTSLIPTDATPFLEEVQGQKWLKRSVKASFRGNVWQVDVEWMLGKWVPDIYWPKQLANFTAPTNPPIEDDD